MVESAEETVYFTFPMQIFMTRNIKTPILRAVDFLFNPEASKLDKLKVLRVLLKAVRDISKLPEPTIENTWHPNSHNMIRLRDWFLDWLVEENLLDTNRRMFVKHLIDFGIIIHDFDPPWRKEINKLRKKALEMEWKED